jgi:hypothetical protein
MPPLPIKETAAGLDLSPRIARSDTVAASPAAAVETIICTLAIPTDVAVALGVQLFGWAAFTVGASGVSGNLRIRQTNASGTVVSATGATTVTAANLVERSVQGFDASPPSGGVYVLTLTVGSGAAESTVSDVQLLALVI